MQIEIMYLSTFGMIFLDFVFRRYKRLRVNGANFVEKDDLSPYKIFM